MTRFKTFCRRCSGHKDFLPRKLLDVKVDVKAPRRNATPEKQLDDLAASFRKAARINEGTASGLVVADAMYCSSSSPSSSPQQGICPGHLESGLDLLQIGLPASLPMPSGPSSPAA